MQLDTPLSTRISSRLIALAGVLLSICLASRSPGQEAETFFENRIRPILAENCFKCHGGKASKGGVRLDQRTALLAKGEDGPVIIPGKPGQGRLMAAVRHTGEIKMPPKKRLPPAEIKALSDWITAGAPWPEQPEDNPGAAVQKNDPASHWAFRKIRDPGPPDDTTEWAINPIDLFVLRRLKSSGMTPSQPARRGKLLRRTTFALLGLPPTPQELYSFEKDDSPGAWEKVIDRLLSSASYGERWGRHWLDVARYSDTRGYVFTAERKYPFSYTYRDYVINSFNDDLPFDTFIHHQVAADRLALGEDKRPLAALGYLTLGRRFLNNKHDIIDDLIDVVTRGMMGLTVQCARCHDHKYDPIPTADYYSLYGIFASSREPKELPAIGAIYPEAHSSKQPQRAMSMEDLPKPVNPRIFKRGKSSNPGDRVPRRFLEILSPGERKPYSTGSGRLELAGSIASPRNPLTARVIVNRVWKHHFSNAIVRTPSDFGIRGDKPTHPELLDWLASRFIEDGWSIKALHRRILLSATYRQASSLRRKYYLKDPQNLLLWRVTPMRLEFEAMRDSMLQAAGRLDRNMGGTSVDIFKRPFSKRRTVYKFIDRQNLPATLRNFDFAIPDSTSAGRYQTTVPQQALFLMNGSFTEEQARKVLERPLYREISDPGKKITRLYRNIYSRRPDTEEMNLALKYLEENTPERWTSYVKALLLANEFVFLD